MSNGKYGQRRTSKQYLDWLAEDKSPTGIQRGVDNLNRLIRQLVEDDAQKKEYDTISTRCECAVALYKEWF